MRTFIIKLCVCILVLTNYSISARAQELPIGFVDLATQAPDIIVNLRCGHSDNLAGQPLAGCNSQQAMVTLETAENLYKVQQELVTHGYNLVVYNAYYPKRAYKQIKAQLRSKKNPKIIISKAGYVPTPASTKTLKAKKAHIRGSTIDVTIIPLGKRPADLVKPIARSFAGYPFIFYLNDNTLDMGTSYDTISPLSAPTNRQVSVIAQQNRQFLQKIMKKYGFEPSQDYWWQFTLQREPYIDSEFDFDT